MLSYVFFFFKQKTAYEMRISDWSSDVCSSDLRLTFWLRPTEGERQDCGRGVEALQTHPSSRRYAQRYNTAATDPLRVSRRQFFHPRLPLSGQPDRRLCPICRSLSAFHCRLPRRSDGTARTSVV